jgi:hypothetical protein
MLHSSLHPFLANQVHHERFLDLGFLSLGLKVLKKHVKVIVEFGGE